jgi:hypothetical protein
VMVENRFADGYLSGCVNCVVAGCGEIAGSIGSLPLFSFIATAI